MGDGPAAVKARRTRTLQKIKFQKTYTYDLHIIARRLISPTSSSASP